MRRTPSIHHATLIFKRSELLYDVENYAFVEADIINTEDEHARHQIADIVQEGNVDRVTRILNLAHAECTEMLYPYTKSRLPDGHQEMSDGLTSPEEYAITLTLPDGFSQSTLLLLKEMIHEYLVCRVLGDWMSIVNPESKANWEEKRLSMKKKIQTSLLSRRGMVRRRLKPF